MSPASGIVRGSAPASLLNHRARIVAPVGVGVDDYGHERVDGADVRYDALPCRAWASTERAETFSEKNQGSIEVLRIVCARDAAVDHTCTVESIADRSGLLVFDGPAKVLGVTRKADHMVIVARAVSGGRAA